MTDSLEYGEVGVIMRGTEGTLQVYLIWPHALGRSQQVWTLPDSLSPPGQGPTCDVRKFNDVTGLHLSLLLVWLARLSVCRPLLGFIIYLFARRKARGGEGGRALLLRCCYQAGHYILIYQLINALTLTQLSGQKSNHGGNSCSSL